MSHGLVPSKSTVYVSNLPFSLTNNDLHKVFAKYGKVVKVTVVKDRITRKSKGVAFVFFLKKEDAKNCANSLNGQQMFGRTLKSSIARDNGRSAEFIHKKQYTDKSQCYECGEEGHLSYACPANALGEREPPPKKERKRKKKTENQVEDYSAFDSDDENWRARKPSLTTCETDEEEDEESDKPDLETLSAVIRMEQEKYSSTNEPTVMKRKRIKKDSYFSDEEELSE